MAEKKYIEREAFRREIDEHRPGRSYEDAWALTILDSIPAADVRPVVLCKDCVYLTHDEYGAWCFNNYEANLKDDDFCSHGKRKEKQT